MTDNVHTFIDAGGVRLCLEQRGGGPRAVLFVHGWISSRRMWYDVTDRLDAGRYTQYLLDFRGCGLSDRPSGLYNLSGWAADLRAALAHVDGPVTIVAHSLGARIAQFIASERPANLERLIFIAPRSSKGLARNDKQLQLATQAFGSRVAIEAFQRSAMARTIASQTMARVVDDALICAPGAWFDWFVPDVTEDFVERMAQIDVPVLAIAGERDPLAAPSRVKREVASVIPGCIFSMLRGAGHNLPVETPDDIAGAIERFVV